MASTEIPDSFLFLTGFMGVGKSYWGRNLAIRLEASFVDVDEKIEEIEELSISNIFESRGEAYFRDLEIQTLKKIVKSAGKPSIIALGGGTLMNTLNQKRIENKGPLICLQKIGYNGGVEDILKRPLLQKKGLTSLFEERIQGYSISNACIRVDLLSHEQIIRQLIKLWICHGKAR
jgi:shikimate kinase